MVIFFPNLIDLLRIIINNKIFLYIFAGIISGIWGFVNRGFWIYGDRGFGNDYEAC